MHKIGILSDTHGQIRPGVREILAECEMILHAGDLDDPGTLAELKAIAPVLAVRGNADAGWGEELPVVLETELYGLRIRMAHKKKDLPADADGVDLVILGHTHRYKDRIEKGIRRVNPGSCGKSRPGSALTMAVLTIGESGSFEIRRIDLMKNEPKEAEGIPAGLGEILPAIMRDIDKGRSVEALSKKYRISKELSENICRMYLTHQNIDVDGILRRLGL